MKFIIGHHLLKRADRDSVSLISVKAGMRLYSNGHALFDLEVNEDLVGVELIAEIPEWRPLEARSRVWTEVSFEKQAPTSRGYLQFVVERIKEFNPVTSAFRKWDAMPCVLA
jgi:hypothetical protein